MHTVSLPPGRHAIDPVVSSTKMMSVSATSNCAWQVTWMVLFVKPNIFMIVIGSSARAMASTWLSLVLEGVKQTLLVPIHDALKLLSKNSVARCVAVSSRVVLVFETLMNLRPASTPASQAGAAS